MVVNSGTSNNQQQQEGVMSYVEQFVTKVETRAASVHTLRKRVEFGDVPRWTHWVGF